MLNFGVAGLSVVFNPDGGLLDDVVIERDGYTLRPLHRAPWIDTPADVPVDSPPHLRRLAGDFFYAPFAAADLEDAPSHGWAANGQWNLQDSESDTAGVLRTTLRLDPHERTHVRYAFGAIPAPPGWREVADVAVGDGQMTISDIGGEQAHVPFDVDFFAEL